MERGERLPEARGAASASVWADIAQALDDGDLAASLERMAAALAAGCDAVTLSTFLLTYTSRNDACLHQGRDLQFTCSTLLAYSRMVSPLKGRLLASLLRFLAFQEKDHGLWKILTEKF